MKRCSLTLPATPPSALAPLSEKTMTSVLSSAPRLSSDERTRPICASVWVRKPANTSCWRANMRRSSAGRSAQACTHSGRSVSTVPGGTMPVALCRANTSARQASHPLSNTPRYGVDPLGRHVVRGVHGAEREVQEVGLARRPLLLVLHHADRLVGQVFAQVVALLGTSRGALCSGCRRRGSGPSGWCRLGGTRSSARSRAREARCRRARRPSVATGVSGATCPRPGSNSRYRAAGGEGWQPTSAAGRCSPGKPTGCRPGSPSRRHGGCAR